MWLVIFTISIAFSSAAAWGADPLGMVLQSSGEARVQREGESRPVQLADLLYAADVLAVETGQVSFLFCPTSEMVALSAGASVSLQASTIDSIEGPAPSRTPAGGCRLPQVALGTESLERVGGFRARGYPPIPIYLGGRISTASPVFRWDAVEEAQDYFVLVRDEMGIVRWQQDTAGTSLAYPESGPPLEERAYQWEVQARKDGQIIARQSAAFQVAPDAAALAAPPAGPAELLIEAVRLESEGYYSEAAEYFCRLRADNPDDLRLTRRLAWLYQSSGLIVTAALEKERLETAESRP